jgi:uncharacterized protein (DUF433 family)
MTISLAAEPVPLEQDEQGTIRVKASRITLDTILAAFKKGETAEEISESFPTLDLADIYSIIAYYLHHQEQVEAYLGEQDSKSAQIRQKIEKQYPTSEIRARMIALRNQKRQESAS